MSQETGKAGLKNINLKLTFKLEKFEMQVHLTTVAVKERAKKGRKSSMKSSILRM